MGSLASEISDMHDTPSRGRSSSLCDDILHTHWMKVRDLEGYELSYADYDNHDETKSAPGRFETPEMSGAASLKVTRCRRRPIIADISHGAVLGLRTRICGPKLGGCESADHPKLPARPRTNLVFARLFGSGFAGLGVR